MKRFLILLTVIACGMSAQAQTAEDSVKAVIEKLFTAMRNADPKSLRECFSDSVVFQTIGRTEKAGAIVRNEELQGFLDFISKETPGDADEMIRFESVKTDGPLATAWTPYQFYYKGKFSHCGVNHFVLIRFAAGWKVQYLIDTRRREGCE
jgi:hypothetical protein